MKKLLILFLFGSISLFSCNDATTDPDADMFVLKGKIENPNNHSIPGDSKLALVWLVIDNSEQYLYSSGDFNINFSDLSFKIPMESIPDQEVINTFGNAQIAVGYLMFVTNDYPKGKFSEPNEDAYLGFLSDRAIIYIAGDRSELKNLLPWTASFKNGYNFASAVYTDEVNGYWEQYDDKNNLLIQLIADNPMPSFPYWF